MDYLVSVVGLIGLLILFISVFYWGASDERKKKIEKLPYFNFLKTWILVITIWAIVIVFFYARFLRHSDPLGLSEYFK